MAQYRFIGDPRANGHGPSPQVIFGLVFSREEWTEVPPDMDDRAARHSHLERRTDDDSQGPALGVLGATQQPKKRGRPFKVRGDA